MRAGSVMALAGAQQKEPALRERFEPLLPKLGPEPSRRFGRRLMATVKGERESFFRPQPFYFLDDFINSGIFLGGDVVWSF